MAPGSRPPPAFGGGATGKFTIVYMLHNERIGSKHARTLPERPFTLRDAAMAAALQGCTRHGRLRVSQRVSLLTVR